MSLVNGLGSVSEGDKQMKAATKLCQPSLLAMRLAADWEAATPLYEKAALNYKQAKAPEKAIEAYERAAQGQDRLNSPWHAAKHLEQAGECCRKLQRWREVRDLYKRAAEHYGEAGRGQAAAEALSKGGRALEEVDPQGAVEMYMGAVDALEAEGKAGMAADIFHQAIGNQLRRQAWADAVRLQLRWAAACDGVGASSSQAKAYLAAVVVWLFAQNAREAWACYQDALGVPAFSTSQEAFAAEDLFDAYRSGEAAAIEAVAAKPLFKTIDNQVARLARQLPTGDQAFMAEQLKSQKVDGADELQSAVDPDDLT